MFVNLEENHALYIVVGAFFVRVIIQSGDASGDVIERLFPS